MALSSVTDPSVSPQSSPYPGEKSITGSVPQQHSQLQKDRAFQIQTHKQLPPGTTEFIT